MIKRIITALPGIGAAMLPNVTCPACWPVYAGILSSMGLGFLMQGRYFFIVISTLLGFSLFSLVYRARTRRGYIPFILGILAAAIILTGKALSASNYILYIGAALLIAASIWNNLPLKKLNQKANVADENVCPNCKTD